MIYILRLVVHIVVTCPFDDEQILLVFGLLKELLSVIEREGRSQPACHNNLNRLRQKLTDKVKRIKTQYRASLLKERRLVEF